MLLVYLFAYFTRVNFCPFFFLLVSGVAACDCGTRWTFILTVLALSCIVCISMDTNCAPLATDLFWFCYEREFLMSLSEVSKLKLLEPSIQSLDISMNC